MRENERSRVNPLEDLYAAKRVDQQTFSDIWNKLPSAPILNHQTQVPNEPVQGMFVVDPVRGEFCFYLGDEWICIGNKEPTYAIKIFSDTKATVVRPGAFRWVIPKKYDGWYIVDVEGFLGTAGSGPSVLQLSTSAGTLDILSTPVTIAASQLWSVATGTQPVINQARNQVHQGQDLWWDIETAGAGSFGIGGYVMLDRDQIAP